MKIRGTVRLSETKTGVPNLIVHLIEKDTISGEVIGKSFTDRNGHFEFQIDKVKVVDLISGKAPLNIKVFSRDRVLLHSTDPQFVIVKKEITIDIPIPKIKVESLYHSPTIEFLDEKKSTVKEYYPGQSIVLRVKGVIPSYSYNYILRDQIDKILMRGRVLSDSEGQIESNIWPQFGVVGHEDSQSFQDNQSRLDGQFLIFELVSGKEKLAQKRISFNLKLKNPQIFNSDKKGSILNGFEKGKGKAIVSLYDHKLEGNARIYLVNAQHEWRNGDEFRPIVNERNREVYVDIELEKEKPTTVEISDSSLLPSGSYDYILRPIRYGYEDDEVFNLRETDIVTRAFTGLVVRRPFATAVPILGGSVNIAKMSGRNLPDEAPYFQYSNVFQVGEDIYAALDPGLLPSALLGKVVALYVISHKSQADWAIDNSLNHLGVLGGNPGVTIFKTFEHCVNFNRKLVWPNANIEGEYDIIADFGNNVVDINNFVQDDQYNNSLDCIDGYILPGFRIVADPTTEQDFAHCGSFLYNDGSITVNDNYGPITLDQKGVVYFPSDISGATMASQISTAESNYPIVVIAHGNSSAQNSYLGYNYLLEHLAKNGFIAASFYMKPGMVITGRANLILEHISSLKSQFGSHAANNIGIMGHSRGGEAVLTAARLNNLAGNLHDINALISLAPTDIWNNESLGGAYSTPLLVIYGSMDGDVAGMNNTGFRLYDRANGEDKCMVFVYGSTHGRFNTVWGDTDITAGWSSLGPSDIPKLVNADAHQKIAKGYMSSFFRKYLKGENKFDGIFNGDWIPREVSLADSGKVKLYLQHEWTVKTEVDNFEGNHTSSSWQTSSIGDIVTDNGTLTNNPVENELNLIDSHSPHDTGGLQLEWNDLADMLKFNIPAVNKDISNYNALSFRITQKYGSPSNPINQSQDLYVSLEDNAGMQRAVKVSFFQEIPYPHERHSSLLTKSALCTVRIPLDSYTILCQGADEVDLQDVTSIKFEFKSNVSGNIEIDSVQFTN